MPSLDDYLFAVDPAPDELFVASGLAGLFVEAAGTGACGVTTLGPGLLLPPPGLTAAASWAPLGVCPLPLPLALAGEQGWHPGWGQIVLAALAGLGAGSTPSLAEAVLPPCFVLCGAGATGAAGLRLDITAGSGLGRTAAGALWLSPLAGRGHVCSLDSPASGMAASSDAVVALLGQGDPDLAEAVAGLAGGDPDAAAAGLLALVAGRLTYAADGDGDVWRCAPATLARGNGDCEDGAVLLHGLLLAAGLPADRIVTAFGRVGVDRDGHAWVAWRRLRPGAWPCV